VLACDGLCSWLRLWRHVGHVECRDVCACVLAFRTLARSYIASSCPEGCFAFIHYCHFCVLAYLRPSLECFSLSWICGSRLPDSCARVCKPHIDALIRGAIIYYEIASTVQVCAGTWVYAEVDRMINTTATFVLAGPATCVCACVWTGWICVSTRVCVA